MDALFHRIAPWLACAAMAAATSSCAERATSIEGTPHPKDLPSMNPTTPPASDLETATLGGGCFWCIEAVYQELEGVISVESGYAGGHTENPTYEDVCRGNTGHAEVAQIRFDRKRTSFEKVLEVFFQVHDPTQLNRQGNDRGTQYRSVIFFHDDAQRRTAERIETELEASGAWDAKIVTEITPFTRFWKAEDYHQNYFRDNPNKGYCAAIVRPKVEKFRKVFKDSLKKTP